jgi:hypothetical protein
MVCKLTCLKCFSVHQFESDLTVGKPNHAYPDYLLHESHSQLTQFSIDFNLKFNFVDILVL